MDRLGRSAGIIAMAGGALVLVSLIIATLSPASAAFYGLFPGIVLLGAAVPGLYWRTKPATGRLGLGAAWLSGLGSVGIVAAAAYFIGSNQISAAQQSLPEGPATLVAMAASFAWLLGNLGFAVALIRSRVVPARGARLVLAGAALALVMTAFVGADAPPAAMQAATLIFGLVPLGWVLVGHATWRQTVA